MEKEIVNIALDNLNQINGIEALWQENGPLDGTLVLTLNGRKLNFVVNIKREVRNHQLNAIETYLQNYDNFLLIANRIFPKIKDELRNREIPYIEANGNIYLNKNGIFLFVDTNKPIDIKQNKGNRAFTKTGLKVLFYLLQNKEAINLTHREIAENTNIGLGNIPQVFGGLKATGYLLPLNGKAYVWENRKNLLDRWIEDYATILRPKLIKERYTLNGNWQDIHFDTNKTVWGGEPAADILTNHLRPEKFLIYTRESRIDLIKNYRLMPDKNGEIEVLDMFWGENLGDTAPHLLVYVDLMIEGGKRNKETADKIYNEFIQPNL